MLKKTLHTAIAAIAVSTMCLPTAEAAKSDLELNFETAKQYLVLKRALVPNPDGEGDPVPVNYLDGELDFDGKVLAAHVYSRFDLDNFVQGEHVVCEAGSPGFVAFESSLLLRGSNPSNTLTLDTIALEDSKDPANPQAAVACLNAAGDAFLFSFSYQISDATGTWSCAYIVNDELYYYGANGEEVAPRPFNSSVGFVDDEQLLYTGTVMIPRTTCQQ